MTGHYLQHCIAEKRRNRAKYLTWTSIRLKFVKKTRMPNPVKGLGYIKCHSSVAPVLLKALAILWDTTVRRSAVDWEDLKPYWKSEKPHFSRWSTILLFLSFSKTCNHRKKTNRAVVFSCTPFPNILNYRDHRWNLPTIWKTTFLKALEEFS